MTQMSQGTGTETGASNIVYDLVSIQYHALKGAQVYDQYLNDAEQAGITEVTQFIERVKEQDAERASVVHQLLAKFSTVQQGTIDLTQDGQSKQDMANAGAGGAGGAM